MSGVSLHIGLNHVDPNAYGGWDGALAGCINDANSMKGIADTVGYTSTRLIDSEATADVVKQSIADAASTLATGDIYLLTYSGHGGQLDDGNADEEDVLDETWVLWDRELLDDEVGELMAQFDAGVRVFVLSDSCHSGTVLRMVLYESIPKIEPLAKTYPRKRGQKSLSLKLRVMPKDVQVRHFMDNRSMYTSLRKATPTYRDLDVKASALLISGCQDNQLSADGDANGLFTSKLMDVWANGAFVGGYPDFWKQIAATMPATQSPNFYKLGTADVQFEAQKPFTIESPGVIEPIEEPTEEPTEEPIPVSSQSPTVTAPASWSRAGEGPEFTVNTGSNPYFIFEIFSDPTLFADWEARTSENSYANWNDSNASARLQGTTYKLPAYAWDALKGATALYYRIGTTTSADATGWDNYMVSTADDASSSAPSISITA